MVIRKQCFVYVFVGQDPVNKDVALNRIKKELLPKDVEDFNSDVLYAKELKLITLQEKILALPLNSERRIIIIKDCQYLKDNIKEFILDYAKKPFSSMVLVLDITDTAKKNVFLNAISGYSQVYCFKEPPHLDAFALNRQIELKKKDSALRILAQLLKNGERPEMIMGGLRYSWEKYQVEPIELRKRISALLNCDIAIKTGKLKSDFALENLIVKLCGFA